ncbi:MAG: hypothetical protein IJ329_00035 [Clostridia bacterium]|nr:hypothetical protein [Clostridia bacterium]
MKDYDEMRNIDINYEPMVIYKKKGGFFGKFVAVLLGILIGVIAGVGGVAGLGWYAYAKMPIENGTNSVNGILGTEIDYSQYIDGSYGEKTIENLVGDVIDAVEKISNSEGTLNTLNAISPLVRELVAGDGTEANTGLVGMLAEYAITVDPDKAMNRILVKPDGTPESPDNKDIYFVDYIKSCIDDAPLGDVLHALGYETNDVIQTICYGDEGVDYVIDENGEVQMINGAKKLTIGEFLSEDLDSRIQLLPIDSFVPVSFPDDAIMCMLAYGAEYRYEKELDENGNVVMKQVFYEADETPFALKDDEGNDVTANIVSGADTPQAGIVLTHTYTQNETEITETRYLQYNETDGKYYAFEDAEYTKPIRFKKNTIGMLNDGSDSIINGMYVKDLLKVGNKDNERVMISLCYGKENIDWEFDTDGNVQMIGNAKPRTVKELKDGNLFNTLTLKDLLGVEKVESNMILHTLADTAFSDLPDKMNTLTFDQIFPDHVYEYEKDADGNYVLDENGNKIPVYEYAYEKDTDGNYILDTDGNKIPVYKTDENGDYVLDEDGNKIQAYETDENGQPIKTTAAMWSYLFDNPDTVAVERPDYYYLLGHDTDAHGIDQMITNMQANMQTKSLKQLVQDDLIQFDDNPDTAENESVTKKEAFLNSDKTLSDGSIVQDMTVIEMIDWILNKE